MTTFQDPPPQSRRSARQNERGEQQPETPPFVQFTGEQPSFAADPVQADATPTSGRRARPAEPEQALPEPLTYATQGLPPIDFESLPPPAGYTQVPQDPAGYRVRDFSPEGSGRRAAVPPLIEPQQPYPAAAADLDYRTEAGPLAPAAAPPETVAPAATAAEPAAAPQAAEPLLSRRELRQRQAESNAAAGLSAPIDLPQADLPQAPAPQYQAAPPPQEYAAAPPPPQAPTMAPPPPVGPPSTMTAPPAQRSASPNALSNAMAEFESLTRTGQAPGPVAPQPVEPTFIEPLLEQTGGWVAPVGHWSRQADLDDETQPWENTITREVGGGNVATTTSALVLPEIPRPTNFSTALDSTGEVLLTGSIDLPQSLSTGGADPRRYDDPNVDLMYDTQDAEFTGTDSSPVRAIRAVSTHTSSRGVIHASKPHGNRMIVVVFIGTAVLAVTVVGLFIASIVLDVF